MRAILLVFIMVLASHAVYADVQRPHDGLWQMQECRNPRLSYKVRETTTPGSVTVLFDITKEGFVTNIRVQTPDDTRGMTHYVVNALRRWRYFAYFVDGKEAKRTDVKLTFTYSMDGKQTCTHTRLPGLPSTAGDPADPLVAVRSCMQLYYSAQDYAQHRQGIAVVSYDVAPDGEVQHPRLKKSTGYPSMDAKALQAVTHWHYQKFLKAGNPIARKGLNLTLYFGIPLPTGQDPNICITGKPMETSKIHHAPPIRRDPYAPHGNINPN